MSQEDELSDAILVVLANKQDMEGCMSVAEVHQALGLEALKNRTFQVSISIDIFYLNIKFHFYLLDIQNVRNQGRRLRWGHGLVIECFTNT